METQRIIGQPQIHVDAGGANSENDPLGKIKKLSYATALFVASTAASPFALMSVLKSMWSEVKATAALQCMVPGEEEKLKADFFKPSYRQMFLMAAISIGMVVSSVMVFPLYALKNFWAYIRYIPDVLSGKDTSPCLYDSHTNLFNHGLVTPIMCTSAMADAVDMVVDKKNVAPSIKDMCTCWIKTMYETIKAPLVTSYKYDMKIVQKGLLYKAHKMYGGDLGYDLNDLGNIDLNDLSNPDPRDLDI